MSTLNAVTTAIQSTFNYNGEYNIRVAEVEGEVYFVGSDVTNALGYSDSWDAINRHVDAEDTLILNRSNTGFENLSNRGSKGVNESGVYALIFGSNLESAKTFKKWVTSEVLPSIRKTGSYSVQPTVYIPQTLSQALRLAADQAEQLELAAPKVAFVDNLVEKGTNLLATQVAGTYKKSAQWLNKQLEPLGVYNRTVSRGRVFNTWFEEQGLGEMKQTQEGHMQALFTTIGELWIDEQLRKAGLV